MHDRRGDVRLLPAGTRTMTTKLLRLGSPRVCDQECPVVRDQLLLELEGARSIDVLRIVRNNSLGNSLTDSIDLRSVSTTLDTETNVNRRERVLASDKDGLVDLEPQDLGLQEGDGGAIEVNEAATFLCVCDSSRGLWMKGCEHGVQTFMRQGDRLLRHRHRGRGILRHHIALLHLLREEWLSLQHLVWRLS